MINSSSQISTRFSLARKALLLALPVLLAAAMLVYQFSLVRGGADDLTVTILAGYNLVVDSNVSSPSTYAPSVATVAGKFCNKGASTMTNVYGYIGDNLPAGASTPGIYPARTADAAFIAKHPRLDTPGVVYRFNHLGGVLGAKDASRYIGTLAPGECRVQYWHFTYPMCEANDSAPCDGGNSPVWGISNTYFDDLYLNFDIWGTGTYNSSTVSDTKTWTMTMRNEISAMANKIEPNPNGAWFNTNTSVANPGDIITSNGVRYDLGTIRYGFDNDSDYIYDYNAWMQPIGDPAYDPSCFRLIRTSGVLTVSRSGGNPPMIINFTDKLFFANLPEDNNGAIGNVYYTFMAMGGNCAVGLSPYQEVASGSNNEKFNGDFGAGIPPLGSSAAQVTISKTSTPTSVSKGTTFTYNIPFANTSATTKAGLTMSTGGVNMPLVITDTVPNGLEYIGGSAGCTVSGGCTILYSTDSGKTFSSSLGNTRSSAPGSLVVIQWWLNEPLAPLASGTATFQARAPSTAPAYSGSPIIDNTACATFGGGSSFGCGSTVTMLSGTGSIGDLVWNDADSDGGQDAGETGIANVTVQLYYDKNGDGILDPGEPLIATQVTNSSGGYTFSALPGGSMADFIVQVDTSDPDLPVGFGPTSPSQLSVTDLADGAAYTGADFGFGPALRLTKSLVNAGNVYEGDTVTFALQLDNLLPGDGAGGSACQYKVWSSIAHADSSLTPPGGNGGNAQWIAASESRFAPDGKYAYTNMENNSDLLGLSGFNTAAQPGTISSVKVVLYVREKKELKDTDTVDLNIFYNNASVRSYIYTNADKFTEPGGNGKIYLIEEDITNLRTWTWSDFANNLTELQLIGDKGGSSGTSGDIELDAAGFIIGSTGGGSCGGQQQTIVSLPLTDTYDAARLQFVSASLAPNSTVTGLTTPYANTGRLGWANAGPLYAGQTKIIYVTYTALANTGVTPLNTTNTALVRQPLFGSGKPANTPPDSAAPVSIYPAGSVGDLVWYDANGNGSPETSEAGLPGVTVRICDTTGCNNPTFERTTVTDANGAYLFTGLPDRTSYYIYVDSATLPGGAAQWSATATPGNGFEINNTDGLTTNNDRLTMDYGYQRASKATTALFGNVWEDVNGNGSQSLSSGENGLSGVRVWLCASTVATTSCGSSTATATTTTTANGDYLFSGFTAGTYYVKVDVSSLPGGSAGWSNTYDPSGLPDNLSGNISVPAGGYAAYYTFGYNRTGSLTIGDTLFKDWDGDGVQETGELGIPNVTVRLYADDDLDGVIDAGQDSLIATTATDGSGAYSFTNVANRGYIVVVDRSDLDLPASWPNTKDPDGTLNSTATPVIVSSGNVSQIGTAACSGTACNLALDFGYQPRGTASIGDFVWKDLNANGFQDANEPGIANISLSLYLDLNDDGIRDSGDPLVQTVSTAAGGAYQFSYLPAGKYLVVVDESDPDLPTDVFGSRYIISTNDGLAVNGDDNNPLRVSLTDYQQYKLADFGFARPGLIGDTIFRDNDGDGTQDQLSEAGISGVTVRLYLDSNNNGLYNSGVDTLIGSDVTNASGMYTFTGVISGTYFVIVDPSTLPGGSSAWSLTSDPDATNVPCQSSDCDHMVTVNIRPAQYYLSGDFGYRPLGAIGDFVWFDNNNNGVYDTGEAGIGGVTVELILPNGTTQTTVTDTDGYYSFGGLTQNGSYTIRVPNAPANTTATFDADGGLNSSTAFTMNNGLVSYGGSAPCATNCNNRLDFGFRYAGSYSLSGSVFFDANGNGGLYTSSVDTPIGSISVVLYKKQADGTWLQIAVTTTQASGSYAFNNLPTGDYLVSVNRNEPSLTGMTQTADPTACIGGCDNWAAVSLTPAGLTQQDFGFFAIMDCGDLPSSYNASPTTYRTTLTDEGPCHIRATSKVKNFLGSRWDAENNGLPNGTATGDDTNNTSDEDGLTLIHTFDTWAPGLTRQIRVTANITDTNTYVAGWFDWNNNGSFVYTSGPNLGQYEFGEY
ncbi:MAG: SdrD B-like domain-containing protein, partial [Chloroflexota bacterium]